MESIRYKLEVDNLRNLLKQTKKENDFLKKTIPFIKANEIGRKLGEREKLNLNKHRLTQEGAKSKKLQKTVIELRSELTTTQEVLSRQKIEFQKCNLQIKKICQEFEVVKKLRDDEVAAFAKMQNDCYSLKEERDKLHQFVEIVKSGLKYTPSSEEITITDQLEELTQKLRQQTNLTQYNSLCLPRLSESAVESSIKNTPNLIEQSSLPHTILKNEFNKLLETMDYFNKMPIFADEISQSSSLRRTAEGTVNAEKSRNKKRNTWTQTQIKTWSLCQFPTCEEPYKKLGNLKRHFYMDHVVPLWEKTVKRWKRCQLKDKSVYHVERNANGTNVHASSDTDGQQRTDNCNFENMDQGT